MHPAAPCGEDGKLCEVVRRHRRDVNRLEGLAELAYRPPHTSAHVPTHRTPHRGCSPHRGESHAAERFTGMYNYMTVLTPVYMFDRGPGGGEKGNLRPPCAPFTRLHGSRNTPRRDARGSQNAPAPAHTHPRLTVCPHYRTFYGGCRCTWGPRAARPRPWTPPTARHALSTTLALPHAGFARAACRRCSSRASQAEGVRNQAE